MGLKEYLNYQIKGEFARGEPEQDEIRKGEVGGQGGPADVQLPGRGRASVIYGEFRLQWECRFLFR